LREFEQHLSPDLLHRLVEAGEGELRAPELESARRHAAACDGCRLRLEEYREAQQKLESLQVEHSDERTRTPECPPEEEWASVAAGLLGESESAARVDHAARCAFCGPLLREAMEDLSPQLSDEERGLLRQLPSAQDENQQRLAAQLASSGAGAGRGLRSRHMWAWGIAVAAVLALAAVLIIPRMRSGQSAAEKLLAQAYSTNRDLELRIRGAEYAPLSTVRGAESSQPLPLLRAEVLIDRQLAAHPESAAWVALQGRAQLLQGNFQQARSTLQQALRSDPNSPAILTDLATAEFELAQQEGRDEDFMAAAEHLSEALKARPDDPVALYNRALVYESIGSLPLALKDWESYLRVDPSSAWATKVAREHLDRLKKRLGPTPQSELPPSDPAAAAAWLGGRLKQPAPPAGRLDSADERLLDVAVTRWLPDAYSSTGAPGAKEEAERTALARLAKELVKSHHDRWLEDVLATPPSPSLSMGLAALAEAVQLDSAGRPDEAQKQAARAVKLLRAAHSPATLRAEAELAYAYQREVSRSERCAETARSALEELGSHSYLWIEAQLLLEEASCEGMQSHLGVYRRLADRAARVSRAGRYGILYLRSFGFLAAEEGQLSNYRKSWQEDRVGLEEYWSGHYPPVRAYQFYSDMTLGTEAAGDWWVAEGLAQECVETIAQTPNRPVEAMARFLLATVANRAGDRETARTQFRAAAKMFASLPPDPTLDTYQAYAQVYLADLEVQTGEARQAQQRLLKTEPLVRKANNDELGLRFYRGLGEAFLAEGDVPSAEAGLLMAVAIAEHGLHSLKNGAGRVSWERTTADTYRGLVRVELKGRDNPTAALGVWEWYRSGPVRAQERRFGSTLNHLLPTSLKSSPISDASVSSAFSVELGRWLRDAQHALKRESVISYAQFRDGIEIWVFDNRGVTSRWVPVPRGEFDRIARRFGQECADPKSNPALLRSDGRQLYEWLVAPIESRLSTKRVLAFETDGSISRIPMPALVDGRGEYLGDRFAVLFSPGLSYQGGPSRKTSIRTSAHVLVIGAPAISGEWRSMFAPLPEADAEARAVAAKFRSSVLLTGEQATLGIVLRDLPETQVLHFAGHALAEGRREGLLLAAREGAGSRESETEETIGAEVLAASQFNSVNLRQCRLAVLSACSTASGEGATLVDPSSLVGALLVAGVPDVVASRWNVNSAATATMMRVLYGRLLAGDSVARALQRASETVRWNAETAHPYFWAGFSAYGR
jgi:CHAT domain-containing protein/tetratricopeptide (TPR) repeat protein